MSVLQRMVRGKAKEFIQLTPGMIRIGRSVNSHLRLTPLAASKLHAEIECLDTHCELTDLNSRNGTFVNGDRLTRSHVLKHGDKVDFSGATFLFLDAPQEPEDDSTGSSSSHLENRLKVLTPLPEDLDPEQSIRRKLVQAGDVVSSGDLNEFPGIDGPRVIASVDMDDLPLSTWKIEDSTRKLSHVLRLTRALIAFHNHRQINEVLQVLLDLFSAASHALIAVGDESVDGFRIMAAMSRQAGDGVFLCHPLVHRVVADCEGLLVTDHWRNDLNTKPKLTELNRQSLLCVPIPGQDQYCQGIIQLQANDPGRPFTEPDLQRLAVLSHVLGASLPGFRHFA